MLEMRDENYDFAPERTAPRSPLSALLALGAALLFGACAQPPAVEDFLELGLDDSSVEIEPEVDASTPGPGPGGEFDAAPPVIPIPPIVVPEAGTPNRTDAAVSPPKMDAGREAGTSTPPPPVMDASRPPVEAGPVTPPQEAGPGPEAGPVTGNTCATTPAYPTPDACSKCICSRCATQVANCYASNEAAKNTQCKQVRDCATRSNCTSTACYCGASPTCLFPDGPCMAEIESAAGTTDLLSIQAAGDDPNSPVGRSNQVGMCEMSSCAAECGL